MYEMLVEELFVPFIKLPKPAQVTISVILIICLLIAVSRGWKRLLEIWYEDNMHFECVKDDEEPEKKE